MTATASDSMTTLCHILEAASLTPSNMALASSSFTEFPTSLSCHPARRRPSWSLARTLIPHCPVVEIQAASQLIFISPYVVFFQPWTETWRADFEVCVDCISLTTLLISCIMISTFRTLFSKASLHLNFQIIQLVTMHNLHLFPLLDLLPPVSRLHLLSHSSTEKSPTSSKFKPNRRYHICLVHEHPINMCSLVSMASHAGHIVETCKPFRNRFVLTAMEFETNFHMKDVIFGHTDVFQMVCQMFPSPFWTFGWLVSFLGR